MAMRRKGTTGEAGVGEGEEVTVGVSAERVARVLRRMGSRGRYDGACDMDELKLLAHIEKRGRKAGKVRAGAAGVRVVVGPGDDCAVVAMDGGGRGKTRLLLTTDQVIEGRHFLGPIVRRGEKGTKGTAADLVARKAVARSVSDIAAMGGAPAWSLATAALPEDFPQGLADYLFNRFHVWAERFGCPLVGGDLASTEGPAVFTLTVGGVADAERGAVLRSTAKVGDEVFVTGRIGGSFAAGGGGRHVTFVPRVKEGAALVGALGRNLHAMMDVSDGLMLDAERVGRASGVMVEIEGVRVPLHAERKGNVTAAMGDGEDYELLLTAKAGSLKEGRVPGCATKLTRIGVVKKVAGGQAERGKAVGGARLMLEGGKVWKPRRGESGWAHGL